MNSDISCSQCIPSGRALVDSLLINNFQHVSNEAYKIEPELIQWLRDNVNNGKHYIQRQVNVCGSFLVTSEFVQKLSSFMQTVASKAVDKSGPSTPYEKSEIKITLRDQAMVDENALYEHLYGRRYRKLDYVLTMEELSSLLESLLDNPNMNIMQDIQAAFNARASRRKQALKEELAQYWQEKVVIEVELHVMGLMAINNQDPLTRPVDTSYLHWYLSRHSHVKTFNNALHEYLTTFIPKAIERLRSKYWLDDSEIVQGAQNLATSTFPDLPSLVQRLVDFNCVLGIPSTLSPVALIECKRRNLEKMRDTMSGDVSQQFLHLVVILWGVANDGIIYITGKSVPRLLKLLKEDPAQKLSADDHRILAWVSTLKNKVKENAITEVDRMAMRNLANDAVTEWMASNESIDREC